LALPPVKYQMANAMNASVQTMPEVDDLQPGGTCPG
jgi:hypothetical protein